MLTIIQNDPEVPLGAFAGYLAEAGTPYTIARPYAGEKLPPAGDVPAVIVLGGAVGVHDTVRYPFLTPLKEFIRGCMAHDIPFYVAAPTNTVDLSTPTGDDIIIEERSPEEVSCFQDVCTTPDDIQVANPAFDVTPHEYIAAIITEKAVIREPFATNLKSQISNLKTTSQKSKMEANHD